MRIDSRKRRRTRFRVTALPTRLDVMKPHRLSVSWFGLTISLTVCVEPSTSTSLSVPSWFGLTISLTPSTFIEAACAAFRASIRRLGRRRRLRRRRRLWVGMPLQYGSKVPLFLYLLRLVQSSCSGFATATALLRQWLRYGERVHQLSFKPSRVGRERLTRIERKGLNRPHRLKR